MDPVTLAGELERTLEELPERTTAPMRRVRRLFSRRIADRAPVFVLEAARHLLASGRYRWIAYELIADHPQAFHRLDRNTVEGLGAGIDSWHSTDAFARTISGPAWLHGVITAEAIRDWACSPDRWWRRAALVSTVALNIRSHGGHGDVRKTLEICHLLVDDRDDMVVKALSWALRALVVHDPTAVREFLHLHRQVLATRVVREVTNKLQTGLKEPPGA